MIVFLVTVVYILHSTQGYAGFAGPDRDKIVSCYYINWSARSLDISDIEPSLCSYLIYAFVGLDENTFEIKSLDPKQDFDNNGGKGGFKRVAALKEQHKHLKTAVSIGGWNEGSLKYSKMAADPRLRSTFVKSVVNFLNTHKFDGLDLQWECPTKRGGIPEDKKNYVSLIKELSEAFEPQGFFLIGSLLSGRDNMASIYDLVYANFYLDFINVIAYDYHGPWDGVVGSISPLHGYSDDDFFSVEYSVKHLIANGVKPSKIVLNICTHGRIYTLKNPGVKSISFGKTETDSSTAELRAGKFMGYGEICLEIANKSIHWVQEWHEPSSTPYLWDNERFVSYNNPRSIANKVKFAMDYGLGGFAAWSLANDDFRGACDEEIDTFKDFVKRYNEISDQLILKEALVNLKTGNYTSEFYVVKNDKVRLRLPQRKMAKFPLVRTIHDATNLALEEAKVLSEMEKIRELSPTKNPSLSCTRTFTENCQYGTGLQGNVINI